MREEEDVAHQPRPFAIGGPARLATIGGACSRQRIWSEYFGVHRPRVARLGALCHPLVISQRLRIKPQIFLKAAAPVPVLERPKSKRVQPRIRAWRISSEMHARRWRAARAHPRSRLPNRDTPTPVPVEAQARSPLLPATADHKHVRRLCQIPAKPRKTESREILGVPRLRTDSGIDGIMGGRVFGGYSRSKISRSFSSALRTSARCLRGIAGELGVVVRRQRAHEGEIARVVTRAIRRPGSGPPRTSITGHLAPPRQRPRRLGKLRDHARIMGQDAAAHAEPGRSHHIAEQWRRRTSVSGITPARSPLAFSATR